MRREPHNNFWNISKLYIITRIKYHIIIGEIKEVKFLEFWKNNKIKIINFISYIAYIKKLIESNNIIL